MNEIKFYKGDESRIVIDSSNVAASIFCGCFSLADRLCEKILLDTHHNYRGSNMIAFCGDRGEGKTSCMLSVAEFLTQKYSLVELPMIDPSFFEDDNKFINLFLGHLYKFFKENITTKDNPKVREVLTCFSKANRCLKDMEQMQNQMFDSVEDLEVLSSSVNLKDTIKELVAKVLEFVNKKDSALLVCVDDLDMKTQGAYQMCEQLRKYLNVPKCVVLLSVNLTQLSDLIEEEFSCDREDSIKESKSSEIAEKYVLKFLPIDHRISMPSIESLESRPVSFYGNYDDPKPLIEPFNSIREAVLKLIFYKTRYLFYNNLGRTSHIVPKSLRELRQLCSMLLEMPDYIYVHDDAVKLQSNKNNQAIFKAYFFNKWKSEIVNIARREKISTLQTMENVNQINGYVARSLIEEYANAQGGTTTNASSAAMESSKNLNILSFISNRNNPSFNISIGDVFYLINQLKVQKAEDQSLMHRLFFLESYYSMLLYENYDLVSEFDIYRNKSKRITQTHSFDLRFENMNVLQQLVNGSYFTFLPRTLIPPTDQQDNHQPNDVQLINLSNIACFCNRLNSVDKPLSTDEFQLLEFVILCIAGSTDKQSFSEFENEKRSSVYPRNVYIDRRDKYVCFDVTAIFYNLVNIRWAYNRFRHDFFDIAFSRNDSLLREMMDIVTKHDKSLQRDSPSNLQMKLRRLLSKGIIRNADVLKHMTSMMYVNCERIGNVKGKKRLQRFYFNLLSTSKMNLYHVDTHPEIIQFSFLMPIVNMLERIADEQWNSIYCAVV